MERSKTTSVKGSTAVTAEGRGPQSSIRRHTYTHSALPSPEIASTDISQPIKKTPIISRDIGMGVHT
ncbi:hypothetical protein M422DRAFT_247654 [Sphaerobolus stellatus SS14]|nr:hypothetical protein M422DRAFT_247654 [Sphaerobolus stellatus SS14]